MIAGDLVALYRDGAIRGADDPEARFYAALLVLFEARYAGRASFKETRGDSPLPSTACARLTPLPLVKGSLHSCLHLRTWRQSSGGLRPSRASIVLIAIESFANSTDCRGHPGDGSRPRSERRSGPRSKEPESDARSRQEKRNRNQIPLISRYVQNSYTHDSPGSAGGVLQICLFGKKQLCALYAIT